MSLYIKTLGATHWLVNIKFHRSFFHHCLNDNVSMVTQMGSMGSIIEVQWTLSQWGRPRIFFRKHTVGLNCRLLQIKEPAFSKGQHVHAFSETVSMEYSALPHGKNLAWLCCCSRRTQRVCFLVQENKHLRTNFPCEQVMSTMETDMAAF